ncbi:16S rRNA (uracil(1498)-N(3))-methyltransferase [Microbulbifer yueqingensis]|uniref:Ribosomal RNA small subunit methyltransferase E n=1 Tax=Microbulbifer yueqingensis TaxID=658219 RepID=A0A1G9CUB1_9GAMM|nr:16S rRNA (uracil(1498)-N(3))-methyltransferase [Microbulbifer yueqingensis]SDK55217.1 16S rRNA (uracil1498-N3)-methyltransferase [Microbulbifer yueqingensis]
MRVPRIYSHEPLAGQNEVELDEGASRHLVKVLRLQVGRPLVLFDGRGGEYSAELVEAGKRARVRLGDFHGDNRESPLALTLAIGISRGDRFDWVVQKATELGVARIQPLFTERCEVKLKGERLEKKVAHWRQVAVSACEQCARNRVPDVATPQKFASYLEQTDSGDTDLKLVLHHRTDKHLRELGAGQGWPASALLLVGPEGGLSAAEIDAALARDFKPLRLGPRVLRTETAPVAALSVLQYQWGDL